MIDQEITEKILGCCFEVSNELGSGFLESVYEKCLSIELGKAGLKFETQLPIKVYYEGEDVGRYMADILVEDKIIVELKSIQQLVNAHEVQLVNYLVATGKQVGLLFNFGPKKVEVKRKVRELPNMADLSNHSP